MKINPSAPAAVEIAGGRLRELRKRSGDNLRQFAAKASLSLQFISQLETGVRRNTSPEAFARICDALGIPKDQRHQLEARPTAQPDRRSAAA